MERTLPELNILDFTFVLPEIIVEDLLYEKKKFILEETRKINKSIKNIDKIQNEQLKDLIPSEAKLLKSLKRKFQKRKTELNLSIIKNNLVELDQWFDICD